MGKKLLLFVILIWSQALLWCNPIDNTPITKFSELFFDNNNNWAMQIYFPFGYQTISSGMGGFDSVIFIVSNTTSKLNISYPNGTRVGVITSDSLTTPLVINREGDKVVICTYSHYNSSTLIRQDAIMFGNYPGATVGAPDSGYSIFRYSELLLSNNYCTVDFLTKKTFPGIVYDTSGSAGTLEGHFYDKENRLINGYNFPDGTNYILLEAEVSWHSDGSYNTPIFNTIYQPGFISVRLEDFEAFNTTVRIDTFELKNIHPDTIVYQDIHLTDTCLYCTLVDAVKNKVLPQNNELTLINYPNPFNPSTNFYIKIPNAMSGKKENITIYNVKGQLIRILPVNGSSTIQWDSRDMKGRIMSSGVYYYRLVIDNNVMKNGSMILLK
jgi:hypothetical protein